MGASGTEMPTLSEQTYSALVAMMRTVQMRQQTTLKRFIDNKGQVVKLDWKAAMQSSTSMETIIKKYWTAIQTDDFTALNEGVATGSAQHTRNRKSLTDATKKLVVTGQVKALASANQAIIDGNAKKVGDNAKVRKSSTLTGAGAQPRRSISGKK